MKILRYRQDDDSPSTWGWLSNDKIGVLEGTPYGPFQRKEALIPLDQVQLRPPVSPGKIVCVGRNFIAHAADHDVEVPKVPLLFLKPPSAVIGPGEPILIPPQSSQVEHEAELAVVIGERSRWITAEKAGEAILGYTVANDVSARDIQFSDGQWTRGKSFDTFCPLGPWIETDLDPADALITCWVNGQIRQMASTRDMVFPVWQLVAFITSVMTLEPGDVILTGTPAGVGPLEPGDLLTAEIEGIGKLSNPVKADRHSPENKK